MKPTYITCPKCKITRNAEVETCVICLDGGKIKWDSRYEQKRDIKVIEEPQPSIYDSHGGPKVSKEYIDTILKLHNKGLSSVEIGKQLGRDHSTILHWIHKARKLQIP